MKNNILIVVIYLLFCVLLFVCISEKQDFFIDEMFTYSLSNTEHQSLTVSDNKYYLSHDVYSAATEVNNSHRFDYSMVWNNQKNDVHPPLYYFFVHTISSFFPNTFSIWYAGMVNILFALLSLLSLRKLALELTQSEVFKNIVSLGFIFSSCILSMATFFRMYFMALFWIVTQSYLVIRTIDRDLERKDCIYIFMVTVLGALTHYYCVLYTILLSATLFIYFQHQNRKKEAKQYAVTVVASAIVSIAIFPPMLHHIFGSYRARESVENVFFFSGTIERLKTFWRIINVQLLGGLLLVVILATIIIIAFSLMNKKRMDLDSYNKIIILLIPSILYFIGIAKSAIFITDRYIAPVFGLFYVCTFALVYIFLSKHLSHRQVFCIMLILCLSVDIVGYRTCKWEYLYKDNVPLLSAEKKLKNTDLICVYNVEWELSALYMEANNFNRIAFTKECDGESIIKLIGNRNRIAIKILGKGKEESDIIISQINKHSDSLKKNRFLGKTATGSAYYLY